jgi:hypothetical protein
MAYRQPGVTVTQVFANALPALAAFALPNVTVGPIFQVVTRAEAGSYSGSIVTLDWADQIAGTVVDLRDADPTSLIDFPVKVDFADTVVKWQNAATGAVLIGNLNEFTDATLNIFSTVVAGDVIHIASGPSAGDYTVRAKIDNNTLQTNETFPGADTPITYSIRRNIGEISIDTSTLTLDADLGVDFPAGMQSGGKDIVDATVLLTYRALRLENSSNVKEYAKVSELMADFGLDQIVPENPAVFGAYVALSNAVTKTNLLGLKATYLTDESMAYSIAFDILKLEDLYAISVMTQATSVHTALKAHVEGMSEPSKKLERVGLVNRLLVTTSAVTSALTTGGAEGLNATGLILTSAASQFITDGVVPGHFVVITAPGANAGRYQIASVDSQTQLTLVSAASVGVVNAISFYVNRDLSKSEQATVLAAYASSLGSRRMVLTWPDVIKMPVGNAIRELPGYFLNCAIGALTTGLPTQQGLTNLSLALFVGVVHSTRYFDMDQLNTIADGGVMIIVQDVLDQTPCFVRHQLTTDRSAVKFQEYSVTKNVDFIAKFIRTNHQKFIGQYNIVEGTFDDLRTSAKGIITFLSESTKRPKIGGVIKGGKLTRAIQDPVNLDAILETYSLDIPIPLNNLDITIVV